LKRLRLIPRLLSLNGQTRLTIIARDAKTDGVEEADTLALEYAPGRRRFAAKLAKLDGSSVDDVDRELLRLIDAAAELPACEHPAAPAPEELLAAMPAHVRERAEAMLRSPNLIDRIRHDLAAMGIAGDEDTALGVYLVGKSRQLPRPLAGIVHGASSAGKSHVIRTVGKLFPDEAKCVAHHLSPKALYHMGEDTLVHRFVICGERPRRQTDDQADATKQLREMISDAELTAATVETGNGAIKTVCTRVRGPIAFIESASAAQINPEDLNRCVIFPVDESREQTDKICESLAQQAAGELPDLAEEIIPVHHALQRMLRRRGVVIPYAAFLNGRFPKHRIEARRGLGHCFNMIKAVALLRQHAKPPRGDDGGDVVVADAADYAVALPLMRGTLDRLCGRLDAQARRAWELICNALRYAGRDDAAPHERATPAEVFGRVELASWAGVNESAAGGRLRALGGAGYLLQVEQHRGSRKALWQINPKHPPGDVAGEHGLPTVDEVSAACTAREEWWVML
jgi:hypothetical protein